MTLDSRATCPSWLEALVPSPCAGTGSLLCLLPCLGQQPPHCPAKHCVKVSGFIWAFCFAWLCCGSAWDTHTPWQPRGVQGTAGPWIEPFSSSPPSLLPHLFFLSPFCFSLLLYLFFFFPPLFQHGFPKKFFNQSNLRQKIGFVTPGPGIV